MASLGYGRTHKRWCRAARLHGSGTYARQLRTLGLGQGFQHSGWQDWASCGAAHSWYRRRLEQLSLGHAPPLPSPGSLAAFVCSQVAASIPSVVCATRNTLAADDHFADFGDNVPVWASSDEEEAAAIELTVKRGNDVVLRYVQPAHTGSLQRRRGRCPATGHAI